MLLQTNGVWVRKHRNATVPESLFNTLQEEEPTEWTEFEIKEYMATGGRFNLGWIDYILSENKNFNSTLIINPTMPATQPTSLT